MNSIVYLNGRYLRRNEAMISADDRGFLLGDGVFDTLRTYFGALFRHDRHFDRLRKGLEIMGIERPFSSGELRAIFHEVLKRNGMNDAVLRVTVSRGPGERGYEIDRAAKPTVYVSPRPVPDVDRLRAHGVELELSSIPRPLPFLEVIKTTSSGAMALARAMGRTQEVVMLNAQGHVVECAASSIFALMDGTMVAPPKKEGLPSVTREVIEEIAEVQERELTPADLREADGLIIGASSTGPIPVCRFEGAEYRVDSDVMRELLRRFDRLVEEESGFRDARAAR